MSDKVTILGGLAVFVVLAAFPFWYTLGAAGDVSPPDLELPEDGSHCVENKEYMIANHMDLLNRWRNAVVRQRQTQYTSSSGERYEMSLTKTCMGCHTSREAFCTRCHQYANVLPLGSWRESATAERAPRGIGCWDCHVAPKGD